MINISIIIPHKNSFQKLLRLLNTIPDEKDLEVIVIDDDSNSETMKHIESYPFKKNVKTILNESKNGAGQARNIGLDNASGKWVIFADADDCFSDNFLQITQAFLDNTNDIIYFQMNSRNEDGNQSYRHLRYNKLIQDYLTGKESKDYLKCYFLSSLSRMIRRELIEKHKIRFEEILAGNDNLFSLKTAHATQKITATYDVLYTVTESQNSLSTTLSKKLFNSKFNAALRANQFLCSINQAKYQQSILYFLGRSYKFGFSYVLHVITQLIKHRSNIFIGINKMFRIKEVIKRRG